MTTSDKAIHIFIIHVRGQKEREEFIQAQLDKLGFPYEYILEGNMEDLTPDIIDKYFTDNGTSETMYGVYPRTSCAYKGIRAYERIVEKGLKGALVFEDDIRLFPGFKEKFLETLDEIETYHANESLMVNYEESSLLLVPRSQRKEGQHLYKAERDRFAGCYYITNKAAKTIVEYVHKNKCDTTLDRFHTELVEQGLINYYWSYPCLAVQCSCDGSMPTMIPTKPRPLKRLKWFYKRFYKHLLYWFR